MHGEVCMGALIIWLVVMVPVSALLTGLGIFAWRRQKPMWFWSGQAVGEDEIGDVKAYNRANGIMWIVFSLLMWISTFLAFLQHEAGRDSNASWMYPLRACTAFCL